MLVPGDIIIELGLIENYIKTVRSLPVDQFHLDRVENVVLMLEKQLSVLKEYIEWRR